VSSLAELGSVVTRDPEPVRRSAPDVPPALESAVMHALERRPEARPATPAELADELDAKVAEAPTVRIARTRSYARPRRRLQPMWLAVALAVVAVAALVAFAASGDESSPAPATPIPQRADPAQQARAISDWLRENSG
jgi:hypothetical protein